MVSLSENDLLIALLALALILFMARTMAELARRIGQPEVLGELFAGFLLGPSIFGYLLPPVFRSLFLNSASSFVLSGISWIGAVMLLLMAGQELDLDILRAHARPGALAAVFAIVPSLIAGALFAWLFLHRIPPNGIFLGIVLSVTAVSVVSKVLMERGEMRRGFAQTILAAGVASEVVVWLFVAVVSSLHKSSPLLTGLLHTAYALAFFALMMTIGRRFVFWAMRRIRDMGSILKGQLSFVLVLTFVAAAITQSLGLHALLGAFVLGVLLSRAPRTNETLLDGLRSLTLGFFGPVFFALAGMRVDLLKLGSFSAIGTILLLLVVATVVKVLFSSLGAKLGGLRSIESLLVGTAMNLKGGTDVVVAVVGTELGLLSGRVYTMYAIVAMLTVFFSPALMGLLVRWAPPSKEEEERLEYEEASAQAYVPTLERVLVPIDKALRGSLASEVVEQIAKAKHEHGQIFDITELEVRSGRHVAESQAATTARNALGVASDLGTVELKKETVKAPDVVKRIVVASKDYDLVALGANVPARREQFSLGSEQDQIIDQAESDVLIAIDHSAPDFESRSIRRILVPTNGMEYSLSGGDIAGALAAAYDASVTILHVVQPAATEQFAETEKEQLVESASPVAERLGFIIRRFGVRTHLKTRVANTPAEEIRRELDRRRYGLVVMGGIDRGRDNRLYLGHTIQSVLTDIEVPAVLLVAHEKPASTSPME